jgi:hypothetical protein
MNSVLEFAIVGLIVAGAVVFIALKAVAAVRGKKPSCCSTSKADHAPTWVAACDGCSGCSISARKRA